MIKIELIKFEAQDVITVSKEPVVVGPMIPLQPAELVNCQCPPNPNTQHGVDYHNPQCTARGGLHKCGVVD